MKRLPERDRPFLGEQEAWIAFLLPGALAEFRQKESVEVRRNQLNF